MKAGFLIGGGLIVVGLMLEWCVGPVAWDAFAWPVNGWVLAGFVAMVAAVFLLRNRVGAFRFVGSHQAAIPTLVYAVVLTMVMGLTRQDVHGSWLSNMLSHEP